VFTVDALTQESIMDHRKIVILLGAPGSGKGTQALPLSKKLNLPHIATGDLFRLHLKNETDLGKSAKGYINQGLLVPDELVMNMVIERIAEADCKHGFILDGTPRTLAQAFSIQKLLRPNDELKVIALNVNDEVIIERAAGRMLCRSCGAIHHKKTKPPLIEGKCNDCGGELYSRPDDQPEVVKKRLEIYHRETKPLIDHYKKQGVLVEIDGEESSEKVALALKKAVGSHN